MSKDLTIDILSSVQKPARYTGGEFGSIIKSAAETEATIALAFPDVYEVGMSYLGFKILYHLLNKEQGVAAERVYAPWIDLEAKMRERNIPLRTLETKKTLKECDIVGFTLQYELSYTNILNMLDLGGVTILREERREDDPLVIVGGPCVFNPEPLADFFDFAVIGEGEEVMIEVMRALKTWKKAGKPGGRKGFLEEVVKIKGIYVPSFYEPVYNEDGTIKEVRTLRSDIPPVVYKRVVADMNKIDFPTAPIVPFGEIIHDRIMLEIFRGCSRGCRFCHAGMVYRPVRERTPEVLEELSRKLVDNTGYNEISLISLSSADYSCLSPLVHTLIAKFKDERVSVSLPSLRIDSFCVAIAREINAVRKSGLTFAPEAGSQKMRDVINKGVTEEDLLNAVTAAFESGWSSMKLYFMIGLPFETDEDILAIANLARKVQYRYFKVTGRKGCKVTISASAFVPKPYTAFQWFGQNDLATMRHKQLLLKDELKKSKNITYHYHDGKNAIIEAVFARGDRRVGRALYLAWKKGARFDGWTDLFSYDRWIEALTEAGLDKDFYAARARGEKEVFPWEHISPGVNRGFLWNEWQKAYAQKLTHDCRRSTCTGCGVCQRLGVHIIDWQKGVHQDEIAAADNQGS